MAMCIYLLHWILKNTLYNSIYNNKNFKLFHITNYMKKNFSFNVNSKLMC